MQWSCSETIARFILSAMQVADPYRGLPGLRDVGENHHTRRHLDPTPSPVRSPRRPGHGPRLRAQHRRTRRRDRTHRHPLRPGRMRPQHPPARQTGRLLDTRAVRRRVPRGPRTALGIERVPPARAVLGRHARRRDRGPSACGPGLPVDLQLPGIDGSVGRGRHRAPRSTARRDPGRAGPPRGRGHRHRSGVPRRDARSSTAATCAASCPCPRTSSTARSRWRPSRPSTTP